MRTVELKTREQVESELLDNWSIDNTDLEVLPWIQDQSGIYCNIQVIATNTGYTSEYKIRLDVLTIDHIPVKSFIGKSAENMRKHVARFFDSQGYNLSYEHLAYIGFELSKAQLQTSKYIQD